ncbi:Coagulation factor 5/8 C-terminal domain, discoidin domain [Desmophyllum pertusum]|uniref:Coagulation factor 5/8 C-terminal domain, discoidin domain n=1 Tax=Desmophyllum pertusum TaxID=174260 RepID=A0A9W9Z764_9CNID|nr:Coagulation factor 5/8 C-terminal domain, discoidin domain [Desmophyllum pertusum]
MGPSVVAKTVCQKHYINSYVPVEVSCINGNLPILYIYCLSGVWSPETIPDCVESKKKDPSTPCEENRIEMTVLNVPLAHTNPQPLIAAHVPRELITTNKDNYNVLKIVPRGTWSLPGAKAAEDCKMPCPTGKYSMTGLGPSCQDCPRDMYQDKAMQKSCIGMSKWNSHCRPGLKFS